MSNSKFTREMWRAQVLKDKTDLPYGPEWVAVQEEEEARRATEEPPLRGRKVTDETKRRILICLKAGMSASEIADVILISVKAVELAIKNIGQPINERELDCIKASLKLLTNIKKGSGEVNLGRDNWMSYVRDALDESIHTSSEYTGILIDRIELKDLVVK